MKPRIEHAKVSPAARAAMFEIEKYVQQSGLEISLLDLVRIRASQINGCAYCLDMHTKEARARGETEQRLYTLPAWHETPFFSERERAALAWTETVTLIHQGHAPEGVFNEVRKHFKDKELVDLTMAVVAINGWNRLAISFRTEPGKFQVHHPHPQEGDARIPNSLRELRQELRSELQTAAGLGGEIGGAAKTVVERFEAHRAIEEKHALPLLAMLPLLQQEKANGGLADAAKMSDMLRADLPQMMGEHRLIIEALDQMRAAAEKKQRQECIVLAGKLKTHIREEEEIYYPTAMLVGEYARSLSKSDRSDRSARSV